MINFLKRAYTPVKFPWAFEDISQYDLSPPHNHLKFELNQLDYAFKQTYITLLNSIAQHNLDDIKDFSKKKISAALQECFSNLNTQKYSINLINKNCEDTIDVNFYNEKMIIKTSESIWTRLDLSMKLMERYTPSLMIDMFPRNSISFEEGDELAMILRIEAEFKSPLKLMIVDENGEKIRGNNLPESETHLVKYEIKKSTQVKTFMQDFRTYNFVVGVLSGGIKAFEGSHWKIVDIDNYLKEHSVDL